MQKLLLLSGAIGSGKSSVAAELEKRFGFCGISSGTYLRSLGGASSRESLQNLGDQLDRETDFKWIIDKVAWPTIEASSITTRWLLDAVRKRRQIEHFRDRFGNAVRHIHLFAPEAVLSARYGSRSRSDSPSYDRAIAHPNEHAARELMEFADEAYDSSTLTAADIAVAIINNWEDR